MIRFLLSAMVLIAGVTYASPSPVSQEASIPYFESIRPSIIQSIEGTSVFSGDRYGEFEGDLVCHITDGSAWKIHPTSRDTYSRWAVGDIVRIKVRTDWYWFKREHKFQLYNQTRGETAKVMLVQHISEPAPLRIVSTDKYAKNKGYVAVNETVMVYENGHSVPVTHTRWEWRESDFRKILFLSDESVWVIKDHLDDFQLGSHVYIGAQGDPNKYYDFVFIVGDQRDAIWTYGRTQK